MPGNYTYISPEIKQLMVSLSDRYKTREIADICQVSPCTVRRVLRLWRSRGEVVRVPIVQGRPRELDALDLAVSGQFFAKCWRLKHINKVP